MRAVRFSLLSFWLILGLLLLTVPTQAQTALYTFESPVFSLGETTPMLDCAPNTGPSDFLTSFVPERNYGSFSIQNSINPNFSGNYIFGSGWLRVAPNGTIGWWV